MLRESTYAVKKGKATATEEQSGVIQRDFDTLSPAEVVEHADKVWAKKRKELSNLIALDCFGRRPRWQSKNRVDSRW
eukprot:2637980-Amphidinium_carterae.1